MWTIRALNKINISNRYPIPRIDDLLDKLQGSKVFSSLDLCSAYQQVKLSENDYHKTAFRAPFGLYEYKVLSFAVVYLDDILVFSKNPEDHVRHVEEILNRLRKHHFFLKMKKCEFFKSEILF